MDNRRKHIILEDLFESHKKVHLYVLFLLPTAFFILGTIYKSGFTQVLFLFGLLIWLFLAISFIFVKKGLVKTDSGIHFGYFCWGRYVGKDKNKYLDRPTVTILKFKKRQKLAFISAANPDFSSSFNSFDIYLLNKKHTKKDKLIGLKNISRANSAIEFMTKNSDLKFELYSPDFE
ncbi:hypothetical protein INR76_05720 [Marixanthomonas sp. SCSIO 43207]|uniref:hypothetical protein n=1 Tax=Marixanthomonas sp. SCSIO 43207 TaxID=2779360 RepID=UPI001CA8F76E|nr:hypothetical protein [Marixanthomonas sp. SCSIO 43207]UAB82258.1 hypothetical protein INR76_05720 [Marixanthomonas sp. SCSIO 43207]